MFASSPMRLCLAVLSLMAALLLFCPTTHAGTYSWKTTDTSGNTTALSPTFSGGFWYNGYGDPSIPVPYRGGASGNGGSIGTGSTSGQVKSTGTVTVVFTWRPDYAGEPAPPALIMQKGDARWYGNFATAPDAFCSNGLGDAEVRSSSGQSYQGESHGTHYKVFIPDASGTITVELIGAEATQGTTRRVDYSFGSYVEYQIAAYPITISAPDPLGRPDLGDGKNQRVYGAQQPDSYLYVPGAARAVGAPAAAMQWLLASGSVDMAIDNSVIPNTFVHGWTVSGDTLFINTPQNTNNPYPNYQFNSWIFKGLPSQNSSFGNHDVNLYVQNKKTQTAKIQTFYSGDASNWPNADGITPNWYHYYQQVVPFAISYDPDLSAQGFDGMCYWTYAYNRYTKEYIPLVTGTVIGSSAVRITPAPVFEIGPDGFIRVAGKVKLKGILSYLFVSGHESGHASAISNSIEVAYINGSPPAGIIDSDGDSIPDSWEVAHHLNPDDPDTAGYFTTVGGPDGGKGDKESLAEMVGLGRMKQYSSLWQQDWADLGIQYGKQPTYIPFEYDPLDLSQYPSNRLPSTALTDWP